MDEAAYKAWRPLHTKRAQGKTLTPEEEAAYEAGRREMEAEEILPDNIAELRQFRAEIEALEVKHTAALERYKALQAEIAALESQFSEPTRRSLGIGASL